MFSQTTVWQKWWQDSAHRSSHNGKERRYARFASDFSCMPSRMNQSGSFQMVPLLLSNAEADEYHLRTYEHLLQFRQEHCTRGYPVYGNTSVRIPGSRHQIPFFQRSFYLLFYKPLRRPQTIQGNLPVFPLFLWNQEVSYGKAHDPDLPDPSQVPASKVSHVFRRSSAVPAENA